MTLTTAVAMAWVALVLVAGWNRRPSPARLRALAREGERAHSPQPGARLAAAVAGMAETVGAVVLSRMAGSAPARAEGRSRTAIPQATDPATARRLGQALLAGAAALPLIPPAALPLGILVWAVPGMRAKRCERRRLAALAADLPDVVDLLVLAVGAGLTVHLAVRHVARRAPGPLGAELARVCDQAGLGRRLGEALEELPARAGEATRPLVAALLASERYGAPLGPSLERLATEVRAERRRKAEEAARKIPVKLLFPLVSCTLPAFALLTVAPLIASAIRSLSF